MPTGRAAALNLTIVHETKRSIDTSRFAPNRQASGGTTNRDLSVATEGLSVIATFQQLFFYLLLRRWLCIPRTAVWATTRSFTDALNID